MQYGASGYIKSSLDHRGHRKTLPPDPRLWPGNRDAASGRDCRGSGQCLGGAPTFFREFDSRAPGVGEENRSDPKFRYFRRRGLQCECFRRVQVAVQVLDFESDMIYGPALHGSGAGFLRDEVQPNIWNRVPKSVAIPSPGKGRIRDQEMNVIGRHFRVEAGISGEFEEHLVWSK